MPWQEEGQLHLPNDVVQLMLWQRYRLRVPRKNRLPPQDCRCGHKGMPRVGGECGAEEYAVGTEAELAWLEHPRCATSRRRSGRRLRVCSGALASRRSHS